MMPPLPPPPRTERALSSVSDDSNVACLFLRTPHAARTVSPSLHGGAARAFHDTSHSFLTGVPRGATLFPFHR